MRNAAKAIFGVEDDAPFTINQSDLFQVSDLESHWKERVRYYLGVCREARIRLEGDRGVYTRYELNLIYELNYAHMRSAFLTWRSVRRDLNTLLQSYIED